MRMGEQRVIRFLEQVAREGERRGSVLLRSVIRRDKDGGLHR